MICEAICATVLTLISAPHVAPPAPVTVAVSTVLEVEACDDVHVQRLESVGFKGENLREAWAILMRESGGRPDAISSTGDYGVFQLNRAAHGNQPWWDTERLLTWQYNMAVVYEMTDGGRTWYPWDINGKGEWLARYTSRGTYDKYRDWYDKYPC